MSFFGQFLNGIAAVMFWLCTVLFIVFFIGESYLQAIIFLVLAAFNYANSKEAD